MSFQQFQDSFDLTRIRETHTLDLKLEPDQKKCWLPRKFKEPNCSHDICRELRNSELASDFSQFANADGGFLIFGIRESPDGIQIAGLNDLENIRRHIENVVKATCEPMPLFESHEFQYQNKTLLVFWIPPSIEPVWTKCPRKTVKIVRRLDETKLTLGPSQIVEFISDMSRANQIRIKTLFNQQSDNFSTEIELTNGIIERYDDLVARGGDYGGGGVTPRFFRVEVDRVTLIACNTYDFEIHFEGKTSGLDNCIKIPYSAIKHVWRTSKGQIGLVLDLQIVMIGSEIGFSTLLQ